MDMSSFATSMDMATDMAWESGSECGASGDDFWNPDHQPATRMDEAEQVRILLIPFEL
jgi:hypothetical protein